MSVCLGTKDLYKHIEIYVIYNGQISWSFYIVNTGVAERPAEMVRHGRQQQIGWFIYHFEKP